MRRHRSHRNYSAARKRADCRDRRGPALIHAHVTRPYSHSLSDGRKLYKSAEEREEEARRDPISKLALFSSARSIRRSEQIEIWKRKSDNEVREGRRPSAAAEEPSMIRFE